MGLIVSDIKQQKVYDELKSAILKIEALELQVSRASVAIVQQVVPTPSSTIPTPVGDTLLIPGLTLIVSLSPFGNTDWF